MQATGDGERSNRRDNRSADVGFHEFKQLLDRSAHGKMPLNWATGPVLGSLGHKYCFWFNDRLRRNT
jgi:hypothetical protein